MSEPWYAKLFDEDYLRYYTGNLTPEQTSQEVDFITEKLELKPGAQVLDLACGHGRHSLELARRGYLVTGQDLSELFLAKARASAEVAGLDVRWVHADMRQIPFENEFEAVINWYTAFGYLESEEQDLKVLEAIHRALRPGGKLLLDTINQAWLMRNFLPRGWLATAEGGFLLEERSYDLLAGRNTVTATYIGPSGERIVTGHSIRIYTLVELARMLEGTGLELCSTWGGMDSSPYSIASRRLIVLAEKPG